MTNKSPAPIDSAKVEDTGEPVAWITKEQLEALTDLTSDAWVYWRESGHVAEADEIPLCLAAPTPSAGSMPKMTNGNFHCPACGEVKKGPLFCGNCLWQAPEAIDVEIPAIPAASVLTDALQELKNIVNAKRFDHEHFEDDTAYADWVQSRARACIALIAASMGGDPK